MCDAINEFNNGNYVKCIEICSKEIDEANEYALEARNLRGRFFKYSCMIFCLFD
jgi:hypothetical protein